MRDAIVTIDVEALTHRASSDHVKRLIWGDWTDQGKGRSGILEMMDIADSHDVKFSFYLDIAEYDQYGEEIIEAGKSILERGHDLQMHLHPKFLNENTWKEIGFPKPDYSHTVFSDEMSKNMIIHQVQRFNDLFGMLPDSYRGGSFNINRGDIEGLKQMNVKNSSNHAYGSYLKKGKKPLAELYQKLFKYENGVTELGISDIPVNGGYWGLTFPMKLSDGENYGTILETLSKLPEDKAPVVIVLHSWSLLSYGKKHFDGNAEWKEKKLSKIVELLTEKFNVISIKDWLENYVDVDSLETLDLPEPRL